MKLIVNIIKRYTATMISNILIKIKHNLFLI